MEYTIQQFKDQAHFLFGETDMYETSDMLTYAAERIAELDRRIKELEEANRWIPLTEGLPGKNGEYLVAFNTAEGVKVGQSHYFAGSDPWSMGYYNVRIIAIAWRELPEPYTPEAAQ